LAKAILFISIHNPTPEGVGNSILAKADCLFNISIIPLHLKVEAIHGLPPFELPPELPPHLCGGLEDYNSGNPSWALAQFPYSATSPIFPSSNR